jgi:glycerophosphoryl diester phosphodiesterase
VFDGAGQVVSLVSIGGHRGCGVTDSAYAQKRNAGRTAIPAENTLASLLAALRLGADFIETDAIATADGEIVLTHSNDTSMHTFGPQAAVPGKRFIDEMTLAEVQFLRTGASGEARIATLRELLRAVAAEFPGPGTIIDLELKGVQATPRTASQTPPLVGPVLATIRQVGFPLERILFSSFSVHTLEALSAMAPAARTGLLFSSAPAGGVFAEPDLSIEAALERLPKLEAVIPEIRDLTPDMAELAARKGLAILTYGDREESPLTSGSFAAAARQALQLCAHHGVRLGIITDFISDLKQFSAGPRRPV